MWCISSAHTFRSKGEHESPVGESSILESGFVAVDNVPEIRLDLAKHLASHAGKSELFEHLGCSACEAWLVPHCGITTERLFACQLVHDPNHHGLRTESRYGYEVALDQDRLGKSGGEAAHRRAMPPERGPALGLYRRHS
jgi:hypothetical protein